GFTELIAAVAQLAQDAGVRFRTGATVTEIVTVPVRQPAGRRPGRSGRRARAVGVRDRDAAGTQHVLPADVVVAAADLHHVETTMLPRPLQTYPESWWRRRSSGPGAVLVKLGVQDELPALAHH